MRIYSRRLAALERTAQNASEYAVVARMAQDGKLYDELTDSEKDSYCEYWGTPRTVFEEIETAVNGSLDFPLQLKPNEPLTKTVCNVENFIKSNK
ncbi:MAG: hypothetical protein J6L61_03560 [Ruminiclostridium sp.]|nr:hypothetical protein [Ruminiclostridium sp.]